MFCGAVGPEHIGIVTNLQDTLLHDVVNDGRNFEEAGSFRLVREFPSCGQNRDDSS